MIRNKQALVFLRDFRKLYTCKMFSLDDFTVIYIYIDRYLLINEKVRNRPKKKPHTQKKNHKKPTLVLSRTLIFKDNQAKTLSSNLQNNL